MRTPQRITCLFYLVFISACASNKPVIIDNLPMYGQPEITRPDILKVLDQEFIDEGVEKFGTRNEASRILWLQGEKYFRQGNFDFAMRRYNQSWMLDPENYQSYWGFFRVLFERNELDDAIRYLEKSLALVDDPKQKPALLSELGVAYNEKGKLEIAFYDKANQMFAKSTELDPSYYLSWRRWAESLYLQGNYIEAQEKVDHAKSLGLSPFDPVFIKDLEMAISKQ